MGASNIGKKILSSYCRYITFKVFYSFVELFFNGLYQYL